MTNYQPLDAIIDVQTVAQEARSGNSFTCFDIFLLLMMIKEASQRKIHVYMIIYVG